MAYIALWILFSITRMMAAHMQCTDEVCSCTSTDNTGDTCTLECTQPFTCQIINCRPNDPCQIICNATNACSQLTINTNDATNLKLICSKTNACSNTIHTQCSTQTCPLELECQGNNSCINLSYTSNTNYIVSDNNNVNESIWNISNLSLTNPTIIIIIILCIACCFILFISCCFNYIYYKTIKRREELLIKQHHTHSEIQSKSAVTLSPTVSNLSPISPMSPRIPTSPIIIATLSNDNSFPVNKPKLQIQNVIHSNDTDISINEDSENENIGTCNSNKLTLNGMNSNYSMHSTTVSQLPLSMRQIEYQCRLKDEATNEPQQEEESISISRTQSYRL